jgi:hypothetical protein
LRIDAEGESRGARSEVDWQSRFGEPPRQVETGKPQAAPPEGWAKANAIEARPGSAMSAPAPAAPSSLAMSAPAPAAPVEVQA